MKKVFRHIIIVLAALFILAGVPVLSTGYIQNKLSGVDAVSAATVIIDQPSGAYVVFINKDRHLNAGNLDTWQTFFRGEEIDFLRLPERKCRISQRKAACSCLRMGRSCFLRPAAEWEGFPATSSHSGWGMVSRSKRFANCRSEPSARARGRWVWKKRLLAP
mgnify:CR=1 FL=1